MDLGQGADRPARRGLTIPDPEAKDDERMENDA